MKNGDNMREAMTHQPGLRTPRLSRSCSLRSSPPGSHLDSDSETASQSGRQAFPNNAWKAMEIPRAIRQPRSPIKQPDSPASTREPSKGSSFRTMSTRSDRSSVASNGSSRYNPRAKPGSVASQNSRAMSARSSRTGQYSERCSEDHLWRELFHDEPDDRKESRLRGEGKAIGRRAKDSTGMPWRQIPAYDNSGRLSGTGDPHSDRRNLVKASGMPQKKRGGFSPMLDNSEGMKELLAPVSEREKLRCEVGPPSTPSIDSEAKESWMDVVRMRSQAKYGKYDRTPRNGSQQDLSHASVASESVAGDSAVPRPFDLHWSWKKVRNRTATTRLDASHAVKDSCPYQRDDSNGFGAKSIIEAPVRHTDPTPSKLCGAAFTPRVMNHPAEGKRLEAVSHQIAQARRDWHFQQHKLGRDVSGEFDFHAQDVSAVGRTFNNQRNILTRSASEGCFSQSSVTAMITPMHANTAYYRPDDLGQVPQRWGPSLSARWK